MTMFDALDVLRPRYAEMTDPHDRAASDGAPAIQFVNYMSDADSYYEINLIGPYPDAATRDRDLARLSALPLGASRYHGGYEFLRTTIGRANRTVAPDTVAGAASIRGLFAAFWGYAEDEEGE